jgi:signal peptide peptidase SppA
VPRRRQAPARVWELLTETPWAITEEGLRNLLAIADRAALAPEVVSTLVGQPVEDNERLTLRNGVATIPIRGPLFRYANLFVRVSGATSYELVARDFRQALEHPQVGAILLAVDSPGGDVNGCQELAELIYQARGRKPVVAHVSGPGASGAYWIASAADEVVCGETAILGSIGVRMTFVDTKEMERKEGIRVIDIVASQSPRKVVDPAEPDGRAAVQEVVDQLAQVMVEAIARNRGIPVEQLLADYGQGWVLVGQRAVEAGLADRIATYEELHAELEEQVFAGRGQLRPSFPPLRATAKESTMPKSLTGAAAEPQPAASPGAPAATPSAPSPAPSATAPAPARLTREQLVAEYAAELAQLQAEAAQAERARVLAIQALPAAGVEDVRAACVADPACSAEAAAKKILEAQAAQQQAAGQARLKALGQDEAGLRAPAPAAAAATDPNSDAAIAARILATHRAVGGRVALPAGGTDRRTP